MWQKSLALKHNEMMDYAPESQNPATKAESMQTFNTVQNHECTSVGTEDYQNRRMQKFSNTEMTE
jgi:hypothetical protein